MFRGVSTGKNYVHSECIGCLVVIYNCKSCLLAFIDSSTVCCSKKLGSLWEDMGKAMEGEDEIEIGQVDCSSSFPVCSKVDIHSYPTFKLFYNGEEVAKYQGNYFHIIYLLCSVFTWNLCLCFNALVWLAGFGLSFFKLDLFSFFCL